MNRPTKITLTLLGIAASVGLGSLIAAQLWATTTSRCWERAASAPPVSPVASPTPDPFPNTCMTVTISNCPTPAPKKPLREGYHRIECDKCGQEYDTLGGCEHFPTQEEIKHFHLSPKGEAHLIELSKKKYRGEP